MERGRRTSAHVARTTGVLVVLIAALAIGGATSGDPSAHAVQSDAVTTPGDRALLSDVQLRSADGVDEVIFQFTGPDLPSVDAVPLQGPLLTISGETVPVSGAATVGVTMFPASAVDLGNRCVAAAPAVTPGPGEQAVGVAFTCQNPTAGPWPAPRTSRAVPASADPAASLGEAMTEVLGGPNPDEQQAGFSSPFTPATGGLLASATIAADGTAVVDFDPALATVLASPTSAVVDQVLRNLDGTLQQFPSITSAEYRLGGSCAAFFAWLGQPCAQRTASDLGSAGFAPTYTGPDRVTGPTANVTEAVAVSDFEATLTWGIGLRVSVPVTVRSDPETFRVIVAVPHSAPSPPTTVAPVVATPAFTG